MSGYMSACEASCKWGVSESCTRKLCYRGRISGLKRIGRSWVIPKDTKKPADSRKCRHTVQMSIAEEKERSE